MKRKAYIRPVHAGRELVAMAVCTTNGPPIMDSQILEHFPADATGAEIRAWYEGQYVLVFGKPLYSGWGHDGTY